jgi:hypothetical protein
MEKLDIWHHKLIVTILILLIFITGLFFGVKLSGATRGTAGMEIITFALTFLTIVLCFIIFVQVVHLRDEMTTLEREQLMLLRRRK